MPGTAVTFKDLAIPLERESFLLALLRELSGALQDVVGTEEAAGFVSIVGQRIGDQIDADFKNALNLQNLPKDQISSVLVELKRRMHLPVPEVGSYLRSVIRGHVQYYGVPLNTESIRAFRWLVGKLWWRILRRRSQNNRLSWERMERYIDRWFPPARVCHPYPLARFGVTTQGRSRMR